MRHEGFGPYITTLRTNATSKHLHYRNTEQIAQSFEQLTRNSGMSGVARFLLLIVNKC